MNTDWNDLIQRHMAGLTTEDETRRLEAAMKTDDALADLYLRHTDLEVALEVQASSAEVTRGLLTAPQEERRTFRWFSWRPLAAAAAGLVVGLFGASMVFASLTARTPEAKRVLIPLVNPGFESELADAPGNATSQTRVWTGKINGLANGESGVEPAEGQAMLRVKPGGPMQNALIYQVIDLADVSPDRVHELELSASFESDSSEVFHYYGAHLLAYDEPVVVDDKTPFFQLIEDSLANAKQNLKVKPGEKGWRTVTVRMEVPPSASQVIVCLSARAIVKNSPPVERYIDDVKLWAVSKSF